MEAAALVSFPSLRHPPPLLPPKTLTLAPPASLSFRCPRRPRPRRRRVSSLSPPRHVHLPTSASAVAAAETLTADDIGGYEGGEFDWYAQWYPVAPLCDLDRRAPHAKTVLGLDLVVWFDRAAGEWRVFDDRCPHRLAPLSEGRIDPRGRLQCVYHGWCFSGAGDCQFIPQAPALGPPVHKNTKACVAVYPSVVQHNIVWFWPNTDPQYKDILKKKQPPCIPELDDPSFTCTMGIRDLLYGYEVLVENLMDPAHVPYVHRGLIGGIRKRPDPGRVETDREGGGPLEITIEESNKGGFLAKLDRGYFKFIAPCVIYGSASMTSEVSQEVSSAESKKQKRFLLVFLCIPVSPGKSRLIYAFPRNVAVWVDKIVPRWVFHLGQNLVLDSDLYLLHVEERKLASAGLSNWHKSCYVPTTSDAMVLAFRNWLRKYSKHQAGWGTSNVEQFPPTPPREQLLDRYWSHVVQCSSCRVALKVLKVLEVSLQVMSLATIGIFAVAKQSVTSMITRTTAISSAILCFIASRWLAHFIHKSFYYHDYNHAFK